MSGKLGMGRDWCWQPGETEKELRDRGYERSAKRWLKVAT